MKKILFIIIVLLMMSACGMNEADEFNNVTVIPLDNPSDTNAVEVTAQDQTRSLTVRYDVKDNNVFVECIVPNFNFSKENVNTKAKDGEGHIHLFVNGKKVTKIYKAAFIIKGLPKGKHQIKIEVAHNNHTPYEGLVEEFEVEIK
jgi:hypothetical protein